MRTYYQANDGTFFLTEKECRDYEDAISDCIMLDRRLEITNNFDKAKILMFRTDAGAKYFASKHDETWDSTDGAEGIYFLQIDNACSEEYWERVTYDQLKKIINIYEKGAP